MLQDQWEALFALSRLELGRVYRLLFVTEAQAATSGGAASAV